MEEKWLKFYEDGISAHLEYPAITLSEVLHNSAAKFPRHTSIIYMDHQWNYQELDDLASATANLLKDQGVKPGDRVGLHLPNSPQFVFTYYGILRAGAISVPINPNFTGDDLSYIISNSGLKVIFTSVELLPVVKKAASHHLKIIATDIHTPFSPDQEYSAPAYAIRLEKVLFIHSTTDPNLPITSGTTANLQYTGGTTGLYKGAILTHRNLVANAIQFRHWFKNVYQDGEGSFVCAIPLFQIYAMTTAMNTAVFSGSSLLILPKFDLNELMRLIEKYQPNLFMGIPAIYGAIARREGDRRYDLSSIRAFMCGSAPISPTIHQQFEKVTGGKLREGYGLSEASPAVALTPIYGQVKYGSVGVPIPDTEIKIVNPQTGQEITEPGTVGEICVKGPQVMQGYWKQPEETDGVLKDGWLHTGDLVKMDEDGYVFITDRLKDMIIMGGEKIYPREIEDLLSTHPAVLEVAVAGFPHPLRGEVPKAFVTLKKGASASERDLRDFCREHLSKYKVPHKIEFLDDLPRNSAGKILRRLLQENH